MRCLIVDDDESPRRLMSQIVERSGHSAVAVSDGSAATHLAAQQPFDIAIVDLELPGENGCSVIQQIRRVAPNTRVLVVSGHDDRRHVMSALEAGADGYLVKDEVSEALISSLQSVRAGYTPLSPRIAAIMLRQLRKSLERPPVAAEPLARIRPSSPGYRPPTRPPTAPPPDRDLAEGTGPVACVPDEKPLPDET